VAPFDDVSSEPTVGLRRLRSRRGLRRPRPGRSRPAIRRHTPSTSRVRVRKAATCATMRALTIIPEESHSVLIFE